MTERGKENKKHHMGNYVFYIFCSFSSFLSCTFLCSFLAHTKRKLSKLCYTAFTLAFGVRHFVECKIIRTMTALFIMFIMVLHPTVLLLTMKTITQQFELTRRRRSETSFNNNINNKQEKSMRLLCLYMYILEAESDEIRLLQAWILEILMFFC